MTIRFRNKLQIKNNLLVIKLSSLGVTHPEGGVHKKQIKEIVADIAKITSDTKIKIVLVSSGSINAGRSFMDKFHPNSIADLQASSAIGQPILMNAFQKQLDKYNIRSAQVLLTHEDLKNKSRSHNVRASLLSLIDNKIIPIINENDCVSFDEITLGDNDQLSAMICEIINADTLCMLTQADGLFDKDPKFKGAKHFPLINFGDDFSGVKLLSKSSAGRGGMKTKLQAVRKLTPLGINVLIGSFTFKSPILRTLTTEQGSLFLGNPDKAKLKKKSWILTRVRNHAVVKIDQGAKEALLKNASLLPIGVLSVDGKFSRGDSILIKFKNQTIAYGITEYSNKEIELIKKLKTTELSSVLDYIPSKVVIHKDNLILNKG